MHRYAQYESRMMDSGYHEEIPFFRQAIAIIDSSTKLMKEDRILLRNKIKDYMRELRENRQRENQWEEEQIQALIQIFVEANKKKSLAKIQKTDSVMDWIQIRLRKFIDNSKREKHRKEVQTFRNEKYANVKASLDFIKGTTNRSSNRQVTSPLQARSRQHYRNNHIQSNNGEQSNRIALLNARSLSKSKEKPQSIPSQSYSQQSYRKKFDFLRKGKTYDSSQQFQKVQTPSANTSRPLKEFNNRRTSNVSQYSDKSIEKSSLKRASPNCNKGSAITSNHKTSKQRQQTNQHRTFQQYVKASSSNQINQPSKTTKDKLGYDSVPKYTQPIFQNINFSMEKPAWGKAQSHTKQMAPETAEKGQIMLNNNSLSRYEDSTKKIQEMLQKSNNILNQYGNRASGQLLSANTGSSSKYVNNQVETNSISEHLFTSPDFLAQCRKFMSTSSKKNDLAFEEIAALQKQSESSKKLTFTNILGDSRQRSTERVTRLSNMGINEAISQNGSLTISANTPFSQVNFQTRDIVIHSVEQLLLQIFNDGPRNSLDRYQLGLIMSKCDGQCERLLQEYCDLLTKQSGNEGGKFHFQFVPIVKYFSTYGKVLQDSKEHFSTFLCSILDIKKKGFVNTEDIGAFLDSLQNSQIESSSLNSICTMLQEIFRKSCEIEGGGGLMTRWSLYYLQLKRDTDLQYLKYLLSKFQFQIDQDE